MEMPAMTSTAYTSSVAGGEWWDAQQQKAAAGGVLLGGNWANAANNQNGLVAAMAAQAQPKRIEPMSTARIIKVFVADTNENVPLASRVLYTGDEKLTDMTDQELFFEIPIVDLLAKHNDLRAKTADKKQSEKFGRDIMLEPARIRDLKMVVTTVAQF